MDKESKKTQSIKVGERAVDVWDILVGVAKEQAKITYGDLAEKLNINHERAALMMPHALYPIREHCRSEGLPPLGILVVNKGTQIPGKGSGVPESDLREEYEKVYSFDWQSVLNPFRVSNAKRLQTYAEIAVRPEQQKFRQALLEAYDCKCCICGISQEELLEAAHIIPWAEASEEERVSINNGILLCANHHRLFDSKVININAGLITVDEERCKDANILQDSTGEPIKKISLPRNKNHYPQF